jgi:PAS domain S-box-containing protein
LIVREYKDSEINFLKVWGNMLASLINHQRKEEFIEQTRRNYETFFNTIDDFLFVLDLQGNMIHTNTTVSRRLGYSTDELLGKSVLMVHPAERRDEAGRIVGEMLAGSSEFCPVPLVTKSGEYIPVETRVKHGFWDGKAAIFGVTKDISQIKLSEEKFSKAFQSNSALMAISTLDGRFLDVNDTFLKTLGFTREEVIGNNTHNLQIYDNIELRDEMVEKLRQNIPAREYEMKIKTKSGKERTGLFSADTIYIGKDLCLLTMMVDITERKRSEEALRESENRFSLFMDYLPAVVFLKDHEGRTLFINKYMDNAFGASRWVGKTMLEVFPNDFGAKLVADDLKVMKLGYQKLEESMIQLDGKLHFYETQKFAINRLGLDPLLGGISLDITERKQAEEKINQARDEAEKANRAKSEFLSRMSHELRTPMNSILGFAQLMEMGELDPKQKKGVGHILTAGRYLLKLINEVLDISRIEAGRLVLQLESIAVVQVINEILDSIHPQITGRQITLEFENSLSDKISVEADNQRLKQVLLNLLSNAIKYNRIGGLVRIKTEMMPATEGIVPVRISITSTGEAISAENILKLFDPFERIGAEKTETQGTGLGLTVVKSLIEAMNGTIGVESLPGEGNTFWIELPMMGSQKSNKELTEQNVKLTANLAHANDELTLQKEEKEKRAAELKIANIELAFQNEEKENRATEIVIANKELAFRNENEIKTIITEHQEVGTILYVEDNLPGIELVQGIISRYRPLINLIITIYGNNAAKLAIENKPDLILLDLDLPDIHGSEVLKNLKAEPQTSAIPVVIVSADAMHDKIEKLMQAGASDYLTKPLDIVAFLRVVDKWIGKE